MKVLLLIDGNNSDSIDIGNKIKKLLPNNSYVDFIILNNSFKNCIGCFKCWSHSPGVCVINDKGQDFAKEFIESNMVIFINPITFGGYSSNIKRALDRILPNVLPYFKSYKGEIHHQNRYEKYPPTIFLGISNSEKEKKIFSKLIDRNCLNIPQREKLEVIIDKKSLDRDFANDFYNIYLKGVEHCG